MTTGIYSGLEGEKLKIFICHAEEDTDNAMLLYWQLNEVGFDPWIDKEKLLPGQDWELVIKKQMRKTDSIILCLSRLSVSKTGYVQKEVREAVDISEYHPSEDIFLIPIKFDKCEVPLELSKYHWTNLFSEHGIDSIVRSLHARCKQLGINSQNSKVSPIFYEKTFVDIVNKSYKSSSSMNALKGICEHINSGTLSVEILLQFCNHPYWLVRKEAIEQIIKANHANTIDYLFAFKDVSYHVSQSMIREYISKLLSNEISLTDCIKAKTILEHLSLSPKVTELSKKRDLQLLNQIEMHMKQLSENIESN